MIVHICWYPELSPLTYLCGKNLDTGNGWYIKRHNGNFYYTAASRCETCILVAFHYQINRVPHPEYISLPNNFVTHEETKEKYLNES